LAPTIEGETHAKDWHAENATPREGSDQVSSHTVAVEVPLDLTDVGVDTSDALFSEYRRNYEGGRAPIMVATPCRAPSVIF
jgi:hypothetical protein